MGDERPSRFPSRLGRPAVRGRAAGRAGGGRRSTPPSVPATPGSSPLGLARSAAGMRASGLGPRAPPADPRRGGARRRPGSAPVRVARLPRPERRAGRPAGILPAPHPPVARPGGRRAPDRRRVRRRRRDPGQPHRLVQTPSGGAHATPTPSQSAAAASAIALYNKAIQAAEKSAGYHYVATTSFDGVAESATGDAGQNDGTQVFDRAHPIRQRAVQPPAHRRPDRVLRGQRRRPGGPARRHRELRAGARREVDLGDDRRRALQEPAGRHHRRLLRCEFDPSSPPPPST